MVFVNRHSIIESVIFNRVIEKSLVGRHQIFNY